MVEIYVAPTQIALICVPFLTLIVLQSGIARGFGWVGLAFVPQLIFVPAAIAVGATIHLLFIGTPGATEILAWALGGCVTIAIVHFVAFRRAMPADVRAATPAY